MPYLPKQKREAFIFDILADAETLTRDALDAYFTISLMPGKWDEITGKGVVHVEGWIWDICPENRPYDYFQQGRAVEIKQAAQAAYDSLIEIMDDGIVAYKSRNGIA